MAILFIPAEETHVAVLLAIYNYYVENSTATFQITPLSMEAMRAQIFFAEKHYATFVIISREEATREMICGYVTLGRHKVREAFHITAEIAIYLSPDFVGRGIGRQALSFIEAFAKQQGFHTLVTTITADNTASLALCEKMGYEKCAHYRQVGKKFDQLLDLVAFQKIIGEGQRTPQQA